MNMSKKNKIKIVILSLLILVTIFIGIKVFNNKNDNANYVDKYLQFKWLVVDKERTPEDITIDKTFDLKGSYLGNVLYFNVFYVPFEEDGNYYYVDVSKLGNKALLDGITDYQFANIDLSGTPISDATYDYKTMIAKIPKSYYTNESKFAAQLEIETRVDRNDLNELSVKLSVNNNNKKVTINGYKDETQVSIGKYMKNTSKKSDLKVYINGNSKPLNSDLYSYDSKSNTITLKYSPIALNDIRVTKKSWFTKLIGSIFTVFAAPEDIAASSTSPAKIKLSGAPDSSIQVGSIIRLKAEMNAKGEVNWGNTDIANAVSSYINAGLIPWDVTNGITSGTWENIRDDNSISNVHYTNDTDFNFFLRALHVNDDISSTYSDIPFKIVGGSLQNQYELGTPLLLFCAHPTSAAATGATNIPITLKVLDRDDTNRTITILFVTEGEVLSQAAYGVYSFYWDEEETGEIKVQKKIIELNSNGSSIERNATSEDGSFTFDLYSDSACSGTVIDTATTTNGVATFSGLTNGGVYYVKEQNSSLVNVDNCKSVTVDATTATTTTQTSISNFLFMGDSITAGNRNTFTSLDQGGNTVIAKVGGMQNDMYRLITGDSSLGGELPYDGLSIAPNGPFNGVVLETGYNAPQGYGTTNALIDAIQNKYSNTTVYVLKTYKVESTGWAANYASSKGKTAAEYNELIDTHNQAVQGHCEQQISNCYFLDVTTNLVDSNGQLKSEYTSDGLHLNSAGYTIYMQNIENHIKATSSSSSETVVHSVKIDYKNRKDYYCYKVKKVDAEDSDEVISGIDFKLTGLSDSAQVSKTTNSSGIVTFSNLEYQNYKLEETSQDGTEGYWNDSNNNANNITVDKTTLTKMTFNSSNNTYSCPSAVTTYTKNDHKQYYCIKVKKVDGSTNEPISGASFKATIGSDVVEHADDWDGSNDGYTTFFTGTLNGTFSVVETVAPEGYDLYNGELQAKAKIISREMTKTEAEAACKIMDPTTFEATSIPTAPDYKKILTWYKVSEDGTKAVGAEFNVFKTNGTKIYNTGKADITDSNGVTKNCYVGTTTATNNSDKFISDANGEVCVSGLTDAKYDVTETKPAKYHTFGNTVTKRNLLTSTSFKAMDNSNKWINYKTVFEFTKNVSSGDDAAWKTLTTNELKKIPFVITDDNGNILSFIKTSDGVYEFSGNTIDKPSGDTTTKLYLDGNRKFKVYHLPSGTYHVKENVSIGSCDCSNESCVGYYGPTYNNASDHTFVINECSNDDANSTVCSSHSKVTKSLTNIPTEISFTKKDLYSYEDASDIVDFENDQERNDFDKIVFKVKDSNGNYMKFVKVGNTGTCLTDNSYAEYRYVSESEYNLLSTEQRNNLVEELHTCGGHIKITHLCRGKKYYIEEVSVPTGSVFTLPEKASDRIREYNIPCCGNEETPTSSTAVINDKGTRVRFEKRDSKYNYLIPDETTTFNVYQCELGTECHPTVSTDNVKTLIKFSERAIISNDEEDINDAEGIAGVEVYNAMSDSDAESGKTYVTDVHPYHGILVLRYLPSGYNYVLVETVAPKNYMLPSGLDAETEFTVSSTSVSVKEVDMPNVPTSLIIRKYDSDGKLLTGAEFRVYVGKTCDKNLSAMNQPKTPLHLKTIRDGVYENRPNTDTFIITTCSNKNGECSSIPVDETTKLTYTDYLGTWSDFSEITTESGNGIELLEGEALIQYLEYGHCYIIEEVKAPKGYSLPENEEDRFTMVNIDVNEKYAKDTNKALVNTPTPFTFYKFDENNNLIDGAEFKLQKLNNNLIYEDLTVTKEEKNGEFFYKVDKESTNKTITTKDGKATVYYLEAGQYRILETKAAPGNILGKNPNIATFYVDDNGNVHGNSIITNKPKTEKIEVLGSSSAEYVIGIKTGKAVVKYGLIFMSIICTIAVLMIFIKKRHKGE